MKTTRSKKGMIYNKTLGACFYCGEPLEPFGPWEIDHITPKSLGGNDSIDNLVPSCRFCNRSKWAFALAEWKQNMLLKTLSLPMELEIDLQKYSRYFSGKWSWPEVQGKIDELQELITELLEIEFYFERVDDN